MIGIAKRRAQEPFQYGEVLERFSPNNLQICCINHSVRNTERQFYYCIPQGQKVFQRAAGKEDW